MRGFSPEDFALYHPGGSLGRTLMRVEDVMRTGRRIRRAGVDETVRAVFVRLAGPRRRSGAVLVVDPGDRLLGIFTDSDLVRLFEARREGDLDLPIGSVMTAGPFRVAVGSPLGEATPRPAQTWAKGGVVATAASNNDVRNARMWCIMPWLEGTRAVITFEGVHKQYGSLHVLAGVNLEIPTGQKVVIIGPSGSGKSTLLRCINKLEEISAGRIVVDGQDVHHPRTDINKLRAEIGMVFQGFNLFPHKTVLENVTLAPIMVRGMAQADAEALGRELLERVGMAHKAGNYPAQLSGGQQQRVAIARGLAMKP